MSIYIFDVFMVYLIIGSRKLWNLFIDTVYIYIKKDS